MSREQLGGTPARLAVTQVLTNQIFKLPPVWRRARQPITIVDVAERLIAESGQGIEIHFTGLRQGEKMHEVLFSDREARAQSAHPIISHVRVEPVSPVEAPTARPPHDGVADRRGPWQQRDTERAQAGASERMSV